MYLIPRMFVEDEVEHNGPHITIPPRPIHPTVPGTASADLYGVTNPETLARAGKRGIGALVLGFGGPEEVAKKNQIYRDAWATAKRRPGRLSPQPASCRTLPDDHPRRRRGSPEIGIRASAISMNR